MFGMAKKTQQGSCLLVPLGRRYCKGMTMCGQLGRKEVFINYKSEPLGILVAAVKYLVSGIGKTHLVCFIIC